MAALELALVTFYLVAMCTLTDGPGGVFYRLRKRQWLPLHCAICLAPWAALVALLASFYLPDVVLHVFALAGAVVAANEVIERLGT